jgi:hypothetical protein
LYVCSLLRYLLIVCFLMLGEEGVFCGFRADASSIGKLLMVVGHGNHIPIQVSIVCGLLVILHTLGILGAGGDGTPCS